MDTTAGDYASFLSNCRKRVEAVRSPFLKMPKGPQVERLQASTSMPGKPNFDVEAFLDSVGLPRRVKEFRKGQVIFSQGQPAVNVIFVRHGSVKITVVSSSGRVAVVAILGQGDFFGEGCLADQPFYMATATAIVPTSVLVIKKSELIRILRAQHRFCEPFVSYMINRTIRAEEHLIDQLFNSTEKRLARTLLRLARYGKQDQPQTTLPKISQQTLAEMIGSTRTQVNFFMNKFRKLGFVNYNGDLKIHRSLLSVILND
jgi:CRP/FNR family transcriptional regulator, cyclic AMP receptor protein